MNAQQYEKKVKDFLAGMDRGSYHDHCMDVLRDFGVFAYPELEKKVAVQRALDKLSHDDLKVLGLQQYLPPGAQDDYDPSL